MPHDLDIASLDLGHLALFVGQRINDLVLEKLAVEGYGDLRVAHGYIFQHLLAGPRTITDLAARLGISQQAASKAVRELVELEYLVASPGSDRRAREVALSERALASVALTRKLRARIEQRFARKHGAELERARTLLASVLGGLGGAGAVRRRAVREPR